MEISNVRGISSFHTHGAERVHGHSSASAEFLSGHPVRSKPVRPLPKGLLEMYLCEIGRYKLLTREQEIALAIRIREKGDEKAAQKLITSNLRLVAKIAIGFGPHWTGNQLDLIQAGNLGLVKAARKFDPSKGVKFSYYASFWIKAYILKFIIDNWKLVKIGTTSTQRKLFFRMRRVKESLRVQGRSPTPVDLAEALDTTEQEVIEMTQRMGAREVSLSYPKNESSEEPYEAFISDPGPRPDEQVSENHDLRILRSLLEKYRKTLYGREADIFDQRILAESPVTLQELAKKHHLSRERIRQLQQKMVRDIEAWLKKEVPYFEEAYGGFA